MCKEKLKSLITSFSPDGEYFCILYPSGLLKVWRTSDGTLLAEWKEAGDKPDIHYTCMVCSRIGKKLKKGHGIYMVAIGSESGDILAVDAFTGQTKWQSNKNQTAGVLRLTYAKKGESLLAIATNGMTYELNSGTGEILREFRSSKRSPLASAFSQDGSLLAVASSRLHLLKMENTEEVLKFSVDSGPVHYIYVSDDAKEIVTSGHDEKHLQVWRCDLSAKTAACGPSLLMKRPPVAIECRSDIEEDNLIILGVSESGVAYIWHLKNQTEDEADPTTVRVTAKGDGTSQGKSGNAKKSRSSIISAKLCSTDGPVRVLAAYGLVDSPQFTHVEISNPGEEILINSMTDADKTCVETTGEESAITEKKDVSKDNGNSEATAEVLAKNKKANKKRAATSDPALSSPRRIEDSACSISEISVRCVAFVCHGESIDGVLDDDLNEPTMGEKLSNLTLLDKNKDKDQEKKLSSPHAKLPSADSVHILLKQALNADDRALLLDCLYTQDEKVIANSTLLLSFSDVIKLLNSLISIIESRGAVLACAIPWLRSLLLQHASKIISQESSLLALNSLYQLIDSRVSTFQSALQLSSCLDFLYTGIIDDGFDENDEIIPVILEDTDESDEEKYENAMETDVDEGEEASEGGVSDAEGDEDFMSD